MSQIPAGWAWTTLAELGGLIGGKTPSKAALPFWSNGTVPWFSPKDMKAAVLHRSADQITQQAVETAGMTLLPRESVLMVTRSGILEHTFPVARTSVQCTINQDIKAWRPSLAAEPRYIAHLLRGAGPAILRHCAKAGTTVASVATDKLEAFGLPLAPLAEQKRIADKLDSLIARIDACRERLDRLPALLQRFRDTVLSNAVRGHLTRAWREALEGPGRSGQRSRPDLSRLAGDAKPNDEQLQEWLVDLPECWRVERASQVVEADADIVYGIVQPGPKLAEGVPYVRGMDIVNGEILVEQLLRTSPKIAQRYARASIRGGDVLLGIIRATKVAVVPDELNGANITQGTARFRPSQRILTRYLATVLEAPETQRWLHGHYRGIDMPGLNLGDVRRVPIPLPSLEEQAEVIRRVDSLLSLANNVEASIVTARAEVERLTPALLAKAFRGELVPQDPSDEPATIALAKLTPAKQASTEIRMPRRRRQAA